MLFAGRQDDLADVVPRPTEALAGALRVERRHVLVADDDGPAARATLPEGGAETTQPAVANEDVVVPLSGVHVDGGHVQPRARAAIWAATSSTGRDPSLATVAVASRR